MGLHPLFRTPSFLLSGAWMLGGCIPAPCESQLRSLQCPSREGEENPSSLGQSHMGMGVRDGLGRIFDAKGPCNREWALWKLSLLIFAIATPPEGPLGQKEGGGRILHPFSSWVPTSGHSHIPGLSFHSSVFPCKTCSWHSASANLGDPLSLGWGRPPLCSEPEHLAWLILALCGRGV